MEETMKETIEETMEETTVDTASATTSRPKRSIKIPSRYLDPPEQKKRKVNNFEEAEEESEELAKEETKPVDEISKPKDKNTKMQKSIKGKISAKQRVTNAKHSSGTTYLELGERLGERCKDDPLLKAALQTSKIEPPSSKEEGQEKLFEILARIEKMQKLISKIPTPTLKTPLEKELLAIKQLVTLPETVKCLKAPLALPSQVLPSYGVEVNSSKNTLDKETTDEPHDSTAHQVSMPSASNMIPTTLSNKTALQPINVIADKQTSQSHPSMEQECNMGKYKPLCNNSTFVSLMCKRTGQTFSVLTNYYESACQAQTLAAVVGNLAVGYITPSVVQEARKKEQTILIRQAVDAVRRIARLTVLDKDKYNRNNPQPVLKIVRKGENLNYCKGKERVTDKTEAPKEAEVNSPAKNVDTFINRLDKESVKAMMSDFFKRFKYDEENDKRKQPKSEKQHILKKKKIENNKENVENCEEE